MSTIPERLEKLRAKMQEKGIDIYIIPTADFHQSEYVGEHFKAREYITGFTGSAGTAVVSKTEARLWTDGRYFIQAAKQLEGTTVELMKMGQPGVPKIGEYLETALAEGETVGFDGRVVSVTEGEEYEKIASEKNGKVVYAYDLIDEVWEDRPILSEEPVRSSAFNFASVSAFFAAFIAMLTVVSSSAICLRTIPVRSRIHSSFVSTNFARSLLS